MKIVAKYLIAVYIGASFLSLYSYLADIILHFPPLTIAVTTSGKLPGIFHSV
ncbi:hypothetical protein [Pedobacter sp. JCM 36344]|uniref:hypothetical protein n=1 Tax=Pedobacter sp. JCM 36344 TaxID=3374280 RepID=UPI00397D4BC2